MEIERKFLIKTLPSDLESYPSSHIEQAYLNEQPVLRIRKKDDSYILTYKSKGLHVRKVNFLSPRKPMNIFAPKQMVKSSAKRAISFPFHHTRLNSMYSKVIWHLLSWLK